MARIYIYVIVMKNVAYTETHRMNPARERTICHE